MKTYMARFFNKFLWIGVILTFGLMLATSIRAEEKPIVLKAVTPINPQSYVSEPIFIFKKFVEEVTNGAVAINVLGGVEVIPSEQQFEAIQTGRIDAIVGMTSYYADTVPEAMVLLYAKNGPAEQRESGLFDLLKEAHDKKGDVVYFAHAGGGPDGAFRYYLNKNVSGVEDIKNMRLRVSNSILAATKALGAGPVSIPYSDVYLALQRGLVDGFGTTVAGITADKLEEVTKYVFNEPFYSLNDVILLNKNAWNRIPENLRAELEARAPEFEQMVIDYNTQVVKAENDKLKSSGLEFIELSDAHAQEFYELVSEAGWQQFYKNNPQEGTKIRSMAE